MTDPPLSDATRTLLRQAARAPLTGLESVEPPVLDAAGIEGLLPHRGAFRLLDAIELLDVGRGLVRARCSLQRMAEVLAGHFPGRPVLPGMLQLEAIGQAGALLAAVREGGAAGTPALTHVLGARFVAPVEPRAGSDLTVAARVLEDGLFFIVVGQCIHGGAICSAAALRGLHDPSGRSRTSTGAGAHVTG